MKFTIEGYENMTPEEKVAALEAYEPDMSGTVAKSVFDKTASELAATKKALKERMSEEEAKAAKAAEEHQALLDRVAQVEHEKAVSTYTAAYVAMGYDEKLAGASAEALAKGDIEAVFKNQKFHLETIDKAHKAERLKDPPSPVAGDPTPAMDKAGLAKMTLAEVQKFATENPEIYKSLYKED